MAENHQTPTTEEHVPSVAAVPESPGTAPGDVVVDFEKINDLVKQRNAAARDAVEQSEESTEAEKAPEGANLPSPGAESKADNRQEWEKTSAELDAGQKKPHRGRPPKETAEQTGPKGDKRPAEKTLRKGRPPKADKAATDKAVTEKTAKPVRDKVSKSSGFGELPNKHFCVPLGRKQGKCGHTCPACRSVQARKLLCICG